MQDRIGRLPAGKAVAAAKVAGGYDDRVRMRRAQRIGRPGAGFAQPMAGVDHDDVGPGQFGLDRRGVGAVKPQPALAGMIGQRAQSGAGAGIDCRQLAGLVGPSDVGHFGPQLAQHAGGRAKRAVDHFDDPQASQRVSAFSHHTFSRWRACLTCAREPLIAAARRRQSLCSRIVADVCARAGPSPVVRLHYLTIFDNEVAVRLQAGSADELRFLDQKNR